MLSSIIDGLFVEHNLRKIASGDGSLLFTRSGLARSLGSAGVWNGAYPCYIVSFYHGKSGWIYELENDTKPIIERINSGYYISSFRVAVDIPRAIDQLKMGLKDTDYPQERIVNVFPAENLSAAAIRRLRLTGKLYNYEHGFSPDSPNFVFEEDQRTN